MPVATQKQQSEYREPDEADIAAADFLDKAGITGKLSNSPPGMLDGFGKAVGYGYMRGSASARRALFVAAETAPELLGTGLTDESKQWVQEHLVQPETDRRQQWTPDGASVGKAGHIIGGLVDALTPFVAGGPVGILSTGMNAGMDAVDQGVDPKTATAVATTQAAVAATGFKIPVIGSTLTTRIATGAIGNAAMMEAGRQATQAELNAGGYGNVADQYKGNAESRAIDALMGSVFGVTTHLGAGRPDPTLSQRDATLTASNAQHFVNETMPGEPKVADAPEHHQDMLAIALEQLGKGEPVNVEGKFDPSKFDMPPVPRVVPDLSGYDAMRIALESGGNPNAKPSTSGALGLDQFIPSTWRRVVEIAKPAWAEGLTDKQLLDSRRDPAKSAEMERVLRSGNAAMLEKAGQPVTALNLYAAHHFGGNAVEFAKAAGDTPMRDILTAKQIKANPYLEGLTKDEAIANWTRRARRAGVNVVDGSLVDTNPAGQALRARLVESSDNLAAEYAKLDESKGGTVLNTDTARELSPEYLADRTRSADVHEAASDTIKAIYEDKLAAPTPEGFDPVVRFTAGGTGAGKTTAVNAIADGIRPEITYDTNMNKLESSVQKIEQALSAGRDVEIMYVYRDPVEALQLGALTRAERQIKEFGTGRTVPLEEHAKTHLGVRPVMEEVARRYADDPRVQMRFIDNSRGRGNQALVDLASIPHVEQNGLHERLTAALEEERRAGRISDATYRGFRGAGHEAVLGEAGLQKPQGIYRRGSPSDGGRSEAGDRGQVTGSAHADPLTQAAHEAVAADPNLHILDEDGNLRPASEVLAQAEADAQAAQVEVQAVSAVASCYLRTIQ